jgi:hypothetical protein
LNLYENSIFTGKVTAMKLTKDNVQEVVKWCGGLEVKEHDPLNPGQTFVGVNVPTASGNVRLSEGQYLLQSSSGSFYVSGPNAFEHSFELADEEDFPAAPI